MNLLALDTSTDTAIIGVATEGGLIDRTTATGRSHSRDILPLVESAVEEAGISLTDLDAIVMGQGPGSFTGLRIAVGVVQGLAYGLDIPVAPVSSMACMAQRYCNDNDVKVAVALTARLTEVFYGTYSFTGNLARGTAEERVVDVSAAPQQEGTWIGIGSGWTFREELETSMGVTMQQVVIESKPRLADLLTLGRAVIEAGNAVTAEKAEPVYLREKVAETTAERNQA